MRGVPPVFVISAPLRTGELANTKWPDPVSSEITPASSADDVAAKALNLSAVSATVPVAFGRVIVRSALGSTTVSVVSKASAVAPSKTTPAPSTTGAVSVLLVRVCVPVSVT